MGVVGGWDGCAAMGSVIIVDTNSAESGLYDRILAKAPEGCQVRRERLDVCDVSIVTAHGTLLVERKHVADLCSSLSDGRFREQRARQLAAVDRDERVSVAWIVEGPLLGWHALHKPTDFSNAQMEAAVITTTIRDGLPILRVPDATSCAEAVLYLHKRLAAGDLDGAAATQRARAVGYGDVVHVKKATNKDRCMVWRMMLATTPGVSMSKADAIAALYATPGALVDMLRNRGAASLKELAAVPVGARKLGPAVAKRIIEVFGM